MESTDSVKMSCIMEFTDYGGEGGRKGCISTSFLWPILKCQGKCQSGVWKKVLLGQFSQESWRTEFVCLFFSFYHLLGMKQGSLAEGEGIVMIFLHCPEGWIK